MREILNGRHNTASIAPLPQNMAVSPHSTDDRPARAQALLAKLEGRLFRGSQLPERSATTSGAGWLGDLLPDAERRHETQGRFTHLVTRVPMDGSRGPRGVRFPHSADARRLRSDETAFLARDGRFGELAPGSIAFLDAETTGLAGGTGTYVFLVGLGYFDRDDFVVEQFFMEDFDEEGALIEGLSRRAADFQAIATYNGATFDLPLLRTRFIVHRTPSVWEKPHLDLLPLARRLWRDRLPNCRLGTVERHILGLRRISDVEGALVPQIYFDYLRGARRERLIPVVDHHAQDIVSLAALLGRLGRFVAEPGHPDTAGPMDQIGLAGLFEARGRKEAAMDCLRQALCDLRDPEAAYRVAMRIAWRRKRQGEWREAAALWDAQVQTSPPGAIEHWIELAKYYEHRCKDFARAAEAVRQARCVVDAQCDWRGATATAYTNGPIERILDDLDRRERRLRRRMESAAARVKAAGPTS